MKTIIAAVAAGLIGGGAAIGAVAAGLVPVPQAASTRVSTPLPEAPEPESDSGRDYEAAIAKLGSEIDGLKVVRPASGMSDADVRKLVKSELDKAAKSAPVATKPVDGEIKTAEPPVAPTEQAVREVLAKIDEEKAEQARLNRQATRVANLERTKTFITEGVPTFLKGQLDGSPS
jgi:hypothetical protein